MRLALLAALLLACSAKPQAFITGEPDGGPHDAGPGPIDAAAPEGGAPDGGGPGVDVAVELCSHTFMAGSTLYSYAEHPYPGKLKADLVGIHAIGHDTVQVATPPSYADSQTIAHVRDGYASVICGVSSAASYDQVTFYLGP